MLANLALLLYNIGTWVKPKHKESTLVDDTDIENMHVILFLNQ